MDEEETYGFSMAPEGKRALALMCTGIGMIVGAGVYLVSKYVTDSTLQGVEVMLNNDYTITPKE